MFIEDINVGSKETKRPIQISKTGKWIVGFTGEGY